MVKKAKDKPKARKQTRGEEELEWERLHEEEPQEERRHREEEREERD